MNREDVTELHYIAPMANLESIMQRGILSNAKARRYSPMSVANPKVQERRAERQIPGGLKLHQYANLYFNARNAMLFQIIHPPVVTPDHEMVILRVHHSALDRWGVVVTEFNAAAGPYPRWREVTEGLAILDKTEIFAERWTDSWEHKQRMMAEVLVPWLVPPDYVTGAYVVSEEAAGDLPPAASCLDVKVHPHMFFRSPRP